MLLLAGSASSGSLTEHSLNHSPPSPATAMTPSWQAIRNWAALPPASPGDGFWKCLAQPALVKGSGNAWHGTCWPGAAASPVFCIWGVMSSYPAWALLGCQNTHTVIQQPSQPRTSLHLMAGPQNHLKSKNEIAMLSASLQDSEHTHLPQLWWETYYISWQWYT